MEKGFYYHYKHDPAGAESEHAYEVIGIAKHSESEGLLVMYRPLYANSYYDGVDVSVRPLEMFIEEVEVAAKRVPRFAKITDSTTIARLEEIKEKMYPSETRG